MKTSSVLRALSAAAIAAACVMGLAACSGGEGGSDAASGGVAATVNGTEIAEQKVTDYIQSFRESQNMLDDESWGNWMVDYSLNPAGVRDEVIDYFVDNELKQQAAVENDITVDETAVDEQVEKMRANYSDDDAWQSALTSAGTTEEQYRESVRIAMLESDLKSKITEEEDTDPSDEDVVSMLQQYASAFDGAKRSSHILFNEGDEATAQDVLDQINAGTLDFAAAAQEYSQDTGSAANGGDVGWDMLNTFVTEYTDGLSPLEKDQVSGLVTSQFGIHIIKCTDVFTAPETITSKDDVPEELVDYVTRMAKSSNESSGYSTWFSEYKENAEIVINDMPSGLPYDLDITQYSGTDEHATDTSTSDTTSTDDTATDTTTDDAAGDGTVDVDAGDVTVTTEDGTVITADDATSTDAADNTVTSDDGDVTVTYDTPTEGDAAEEGATE